MPVPFKIQEDELFTSWLGAVANEVYQRTGLPEEDFSRFFLNRSVKYSNLFSRLYPDDLDNLCDYVRGTVLFPDIYDIIEKHSPMGALSPGMTGQTKARMLEHVLRKPDKYSSGSRPFAGFHMCPECRAEDRKRFGRGIVHVPHQICGVKVCPKHGCVLEGYDVDPSGLAVERRIAAYAQAFYDRPFRGGMEGTEKVLDAYMERHSLNGRSFIKKAAADGYLDDEKRACMEYDRRHIAVSGQIFRILAYITESPEEFRQMAGVTDSACAGTDELELLKQSSGLGRYRCRHCGKVFHMHGKAVEAGMLCPSCRGGLSGQEYMGRLLSRFQDGEYEYVSDDYRKIRHKPCGTERGVPKDFWLQAKQGCRVCQRNADRWKDIFGSNGFEFLSKRGTEVHLRHVPCGTVFAYSVANAYDMEASSMSERRKMLICPECRKKYYRGRLPEHAKDYIGMYIRSGTEIGMTVTEAPDRRHVRVRFDNGLERRVALCTVQAILKGRRSGFKEFQIGREATMKDGRHCTIIGYPSYGHLVVEFDGGVRVQSSLESFDRGAVRYRPDCKLKPKISPENDITGSDKNGITG